MRTGASERSHDLSTVPMRQRIFIGLIFFLAPIPLFFDFSALNFFIHKPSNLNDMFSIHLGIPVPLSLFCYVLYQVYGWVHIQNKSNDFVFLLFNRKNLNLIVASLGIYFLAFGMSIPKLVQITLPLLLMINMIVPNNSNTRNGIVKNYCLGIGFLCSVHLLSIYMQNNHSLIGVDRYMNFGTIYSYQIYQSLVTYINVLSLFSLLFFYEVLSNPKNKLIKLIVMLGLILNAGFGGSRMLMGDMLVLSLVASIYLMLHNRKVFFLFIAIVLLVFFTGLHPFTESLHKFELEGTQNRTVLWFIAFDEIYPMLDKYLFFGDGNLTYLAHNFFINLIHGVGLLPMLIITILIAITFKNIGIYSTSVKSSIFIVGAFIMLLLNSSFNTAFTQPLYMTNFLIIIGLIISPVSRYHACSKNA